MKPGSPDFSISTPFDVGETTVQEHSLYCFLLLFVDIQSVKAEQ